MQPETDPPMASDLARKYFRPDRLLIAAALHLRRGPAILIKQGDFASAMLWSSFGSVVDVTSALKGLADVTIRREL